MLLMLLVHAFARRPALRVILEERQGTLAHALCAATSPHCPEMFVLRQQTTSAVYLSQRPCGGMRRAAGSQEGAAAGGHASEGERVGGGSGGRKRPVRCA
jgi:hypothetical protein